MSYEDYRNMADALEKMYTDFQHEETGEDGPSVTVAFPVPLSRQEYTKYVMAPLEGKMKKFTMPQWYKAAFRMLAASADTRCAALDMLGLNSSRFIDAVDASPMLPKLFTSSASSSTH